MAWGNTYYPAKNGTKEIAFHHNCSRTQILKLEFLVDYLILLPWTTTERLFQNWKLLVQMIYSCFALLHNPQWLQPLCSSFQSPFSLKCKRGKCISLPPVQTTEKISTGGQCSTPIWQWRSILYWLSNYAAWFLSYFLNYNILYGIILKINPWQGNQGGEWEWSIFSHPPKLWPTGRKYKTCQHVTQLCLRRKVIAPIPI